MISESILIRRRYESPQRQAALVSASGSKSCNGVPTTAKPLPPTRRRSFTAPPAGFEPATYGLEGASCRVCRW